VDLGFPSADEEGTQLAAGAPALCLGPSGQRSVVLGELRSPMGSGMSSTLFLSSPGASERIMSVMLQASKASESLPSSASLLFSEYGLRGLFGLTPRVLVSAVHGAVTTVQLRDREGDVVFRAPAKEK
jgi:hypothetical protein